MRKILEKDVEGYFVKVSAQHGIWAIKMVPDWIRGFPDRMCLGKNAVVYFVEVKRPGGRVRKLQTFMHEKLRGLGFSVYVISNKEEVDAFYKQERHLRP